MTQDFVFFSRTVSVMFGEHAIQKYLQFSDGNMYLTMGPLEFMLQ